MLIAKSIEARSPCRWLTASHANLGRSRRCRIDDLLDTLTCTPWNGACAKVNVRRRSFYDFEACRRQLIDLRVDPQLAELFFKLGYPDFYPGCLRECCDFEQGVGDDLIPSHRAMAIDVRFEFRLLEQERLDAGSPLRFTVVLRQFPLREVSRYWRTWPQSRFTRGSNEAWLIGSIISKRGRALGTADCTSTAHEQLGPSQQQPRPVVRSRPHAVPIRSRRLKNVFRLQHPEFVEAS